jgi:hypothetical protein
MGVKALAGDGGKQARLRTLAWFILAATALALAVSANAIAAGSTAGARARRVCAAPRPGRASCMSMRLAPTGVQAASAAPQVLGAGHPAVTFPHPFAGFLTAAELHEAYSLPADTPAASLQTIAVVDAFDDPTAEQDLGVYDEQFGLAPCTTANGCFAKINQEGNPSPLPRKQGEWASEMSIDVQMAHAICQSCRVLLVETKSERFSDLGAGVNAAANAGATEISNSYGGPEEPAFASFFEEDNDAFYNHPGLVVTASAGDCGYFEQACPGEPEAADFPADSPDVVGVGGTSLTQKKGVWTSTVWDEGGSGCSVLFQAPPWQTALANFSDTGCASARAVADVAAIGDPNTGVNVYDSTPEFPGGETGWGVWGGTSVASPIIAAEFALAGGAHAVAYPARTLYSHVGQQADLYDVVSGHNGSCSGASACSAVSGYDGPTGVGSPLGVDAFSTPSAPVNSSPPTIAGTVDSGQTLTATPGEWSASPTSTSEQWERCNAEGGGCSAIAGATAAKYTLAEADVGFTIRVQEVASNAAGEGAPAASAPTEAVPSDLFVFTGFTPTSGITGSTVAIEGSNLAAVTEVDFGALPASFEAVSSTLIQAVVPNGAGKAKVSLIGPAGTQTSKARYTPTLSITSFKPTSGAPGGKAVTIKGVGFNGKSVVSFDGHSAATTFVSAKKLTATVPAGAQAGPVSVLNTAAPAGTVYSAGSYTP